MAAASISTSTAPAISIPMRRECSKDGSAKVPGVADGVSLTTVSNSGATVGGV